MLFETATCKFNIIEARYVELTQKAIVFNTSHFFQKKPKSLKLVDRQWHRLMK